MLIKQSEATAARRTVYFTAVNTADDSAYTSTLSGADVRIGKAGGAEADSAGAATHIATGLFKYELTTGECDTLGEVSIRLAKTGVYNDVRTVNVVAFDPYDAAAIGLTNLDAAVSTRLASASYDDTDTFLDTANGVETGLTVRQGLRLITAVLGGKITGAGTGTNTIRNAVADSKNRITASVDASGNRITVTYDLT